MTANWGDSKLRDNFDGHAGTDRRAPKATQQDYLTVNRLSKLLSKSVEKNLQERKATVLDLGCGKKPYQPFFLGKSTYYVGVDVAPSEFVDILCKGERLPFKDSCFSASLCLQVLEHTDDPMAVIEEIFRVLKPGGLLLLSTHGNWPVHGSPHDYWRWTSYGLKKLLTDFHISEILQCGGPAASIIQLMELFVPSRSLGVIVIFLLNKLGDLLDRVAWLNAKLPNLATNYLITARKIKQPKRMGKNQTEYVLGKRG